MPRPPRRPGLPVTVVLLGCTSLFTDIGTEMIFPLMPVFLVETLGAGPTFVGLIEGAADMVASFLKLAAGVLADVTKRRKPLVLFGYAVASAARPFVALATRPWHVLAVRMTDRIGKGVRSSPRDALIADAAGDEPGRAFGFHQAMDNLGAVVGPLLATALLAMNVPMRGVFAVAVVPGVIATALVAMVKETREAQGPKSELAPGLKPGAPLETGTQSPPDGGLLLDPVKGSPPSEAGFARRSSGAQGFSPGASVLRSYLLVLGLFCLGNSSDAFLLLRARSLGLSAPAIPILWSALNLSKVACAYLGGNLADRLPRAKVIAGGWLVFAGVYFGLAEATAPWHVWALFVVYGVFYGLTEPVEKALVKDLVPAERRGRAYGQYNFVVGITALPAGLLTGALWRAVGPSRALQVGAGFALLALVALVVWDSRRPQPERQGG